MRIFFFTLLICCNVIYAQEIRTREYKYRLGVKGIFEKSFGGIKTTHVNNFGIQFVINYSKKSSIEAGVYKVDRTQAMFFPSSTYLNVDSLVNYNVRNIFIPIKYRFDKTFLLWSIFCSAGGYSEILVERHVEQPKNTINIGFPDNRKLVFGFTSTLGVSKKISQRINLNSEFRYSINLTSLYKHEQFMSGSSLSTYNYGVALGLNFMF